MSDYITAEFIETLDREEVADARAMRPADKMALGGDLFDDVIQRMIDGIRHQFPDADEREVDRILDERLALQE